jgi:hypothetical protein
MWVADGSSVAQAPTGSFGALLAPGLRKIWGDKYNDYPEEYSKAFDVLGSSRNYEEDHAITSLGLVPTKTKGKGIDYDTIYDGPTKRYTWVTYGLGFVITREDWDDILYNDTVIKKMPAALARSDRHTIEILAANVLNNATSSSYTGADSKALAATDHPLYGPGGGTMSNMPSSNADLDITSFENALLDIQTNWVDDRGLKAKALARKLVIHPANKFQAAMLLKSAGLPDTANNNINPVAGYPIELVELNWLTDPDAWGIITDIPNGLNFFWRRKPEFTQDNDFDSENAKFKTTFRCGMGWTDFRCLWWTTGA